MARRGHAKKIEVVHWTGARGSSLAQAAGVGVAVNFGAAQHLPETLLRIRGEWACSLDGPQAAGVANVVTAGLILVPEGTSTTVLWDPDTDSDAPWIWWDCFNLLYDEMVTDAVASGRSGGAHRVIDSKAMRKVRNSELQWVVNNTALSGSAAINTAACVRVLAGS